MNSENRGHALATENGQRQEKHGKVYPKPMALHIPQHAVEAVNSLPDDLPVGNEEEEWMLTVTSNNSGVSVDKTFSSLVALRSPLAVADTVKDLINIIRGCEPSEEISVRGW